MFENVEYLELQKGEKFEFSSIECDSRKIQKGDIFVAMKGFLVDGNEYIDSAIKNGAVCVITDNENIDFKKYENISFYYVKDLRLKLGTICSNLYNYPQNKLKVIGVTGTNGKTTTTYILENIFPNSARIGTTNYRIKDKFYEAKNTTPESIDIIKFMAQAVKENVEYFFMEVSSHALSLGRVDMLRFDGAIFTNLTQDHLDYHKTFEEYFKAKCKLIDLLKDEAKISINTDDEYVKKIDRKNNNFGINSGDIRGKVLNYTNKGMKVEVVIGDVVKTFDTKLIGKHNLYNILGVISLLYNMGVDVDYIIEKISAMDSVIGRFELIDNELDAKIVVDYAHTPDGLKNVLSTLKEITENRLICIFGAGGDRDKTKRPLMAEQAGIYSDVVIITSDNPRTEDPIRIIEDVEEGLKKLNYTSYYKIEKREEAIQKGISMLKKGDSLMIAGKGHETYQIIGKEIRHFSDQEEVKKMLKTIYNI